MNKDLKTLHLSHTDLDGSGSIIIAKEYLTDVSHRRITYNAVNENLLKILNSENDFKQLLITDLCFYEEDWKVLQILAKHFDSVTYIDHHIYEFDYTKYLTDNMEVIIDKSKCATSLTYDYFLEKEKSVSRFFDLQKYTNIFDIWLEDNPEFEIAKDYNRVFWALGYKSFETLFFKDPFITKPLENLVKNIHSEIDSYFTEREKEGLIITNEKLVLSFLDRHIGEIKDRYPNQDFALNFRAPSHISVRISSSVDEETANKIRDFILHQVFDEKNLISAGGHARAFGMRLQDLTNEEVIQYIKVIFDKIQKIL